MNYSKLEMLMSITKKSDASKEKKEAYLEEMLLLFSEEGYSSNGENYMIKGFSFLGAQPLALFVKNLNEEEKVEIIKKVLSGAEFKTNKNGNAFKISVSLLAQCLNNFSDNKKCVEILIKELPSKSKNKEGNLLGDATKIIEKYFVAALQKNVVLPKLSELQIKPIFVSEFTNILGNCISTLKPSKDITVPKLTMISNWVSEQNESNCTPITLKEKIIETSNGSNNGEKSKTHTHSMQNKPLRGKELSEFTNLVFTGFSRLGATSEYLVSLEKGTATLQNKIEILTLEINSLKIEKDSLTSRLSNSKNETARAESEKSKLSYNLSTLKNVLSEIETQKKILEEEITKLKSVLSVYTSDNENSRTEKLNAIASKLKVEYLDFSDAESMEMTIELGENLRHQIRTIFKILEKAGIDVGGR